jgi:hypothetical protein
MLMRHHRERKPTREPRIQEKVLVSGEEGLEKDRFAWPVGHIIELIRGRDGVIRTARVDLNGRIMCRPVQSLIPLEGIHAPDAPARGEDVVILAPHANGTPAAR